MVYIGFYSLLFHITLCFSTISISINKATPFFWTASWYSVIYTYHDLFNPLHGEHVDCSQYVSIINKEEEGFFSLYFPFLQVISFNVLVPLLPCVLSAQAYRYLTRHRCKFICLVLVWSFFSFIYLPSFWTKSDHARRMVLLWAFFTQGYKGILLSRSTLPDSVLQGLQGVL